MQFEKINEDKIRITFNLEDLKEKNINYHDFMSNSIETQSVFLDMLNQAEKEIGFITNNYKLIIEALASTDGSFIITVTRSKEQSLKSSKKIKARRKELSLNSTLPTLIYKFNNFDEFHDLCSNISSSYLPKLTKIFNKTILYVYNNNYYLLLKSNPEANTTDIKYIISLINEFCDNIVKNSQIFENKLNEYGKIFIKNNCFIKINRK